MRSRPPERPEQTVERLVGYLPRAQAAPARRPTSATWRRANAVYEPPTCRILARCIEDERRHVAAGETVLRHRRLRAELERAPRAWRGAARGRCSTAAGRRDRGAGCHAGRRGAPRPRARSSDDAAQEFIRPRAVDRHAGRSSRRSAQRWAVRRRAGRGRLAAARGWLAPDVALGADLETRLGRRRAPGSRVVACARARTRSALVKLASRAARATASRSVLRWAPAGAGWRVAAARGRLRFRRAARLTSVLQSVLVANRGEIARRVIRACRALGVRSVAVYSEADARLAPRRRRRRSRRSSGPRPRARAISTSTRILDAARRTGAEAIHPGYGFLSENWRFAQACEAAGLVFVGPPWPVDPADGRQGRTRAASWRRAGVPIVPGSDGPVDSVRGRAGRRRPRSATR